jgi:hypothetical protein
MIVQSRELGAGCRKYLHVSADLGQRVGIFYTLLEDGLRPSGQSRVLDIQPVDLDEGFAAKVFA